MKKTAVNKGDKTSVMLVCFQYSCYKFQHWDCVVLKRPCQHFIIFAFAFLLYKVKLSNLRFGFYMVIIVLSNFIMKAKQNSMALPAHVDA